MNALRGLALATLLGGAGLIIYAAALGDLTVALVLIIPVVVGTGWAAASGTLLLFASALLWFFARSREIAEAPAADAAWGEMPRRKGGGFVLLGPIPLVWGSDRRMFRWMVATGLFLIGLFLAFNWLLR